MSFTGNEEHSISLSEASSLTRNFRNAVGDSAPKGGFFSKAALQTILNQEGCVGIRFYYGQEEDGTPTLILVGADEEENDLIEGKIDQRPIPCPPRCGEANDLNS